MILKTALGADINPSQSRETVSYSIAYLNEDRIIYTAEKVSFKELLKYVRKFKPDVLATDNIFELAKDEGEIRKLAFLLPDQTNLIQVTGNPTNPSDTLINLAKSCGIEVGNKLSPLETAILAARLALKGLGYKIKLREDETFILVTKATEPAAGGMSMNRYKRRIYMNIAHAVAEIKNELVKNNISFDFFPSKHTGDGGVFIVQAQRDLVRKYIKPYDGYGIRIRILPVVRSRIVSKEEIRNISRLIIVGYDPGLTVGIAALDIKGNLLLLESERYAGLDEVREKLAKVGKPIIIATDKSVTPAMINRLASDFGAEIWKPQKDLQIEEKKKLSKDFLGEIGRFEIKLDTHKRDALAAAYLAFKKYRTLYEQIEEELERLNIEDISPQLIFERVLKSKRNIKETIEDELEKRRMHEVIIKEGKQTLNNREELEKIKKKLEEMMRLFKILQDLIAEKEEVITELNKKIEWLKAEERIRIKTNEEISKLKQKIEALKLENERLKNEIENYSRRFNELIGAFEDLTNNKAIILKEEDPASIKENMNLEIRYFRSIPKLEIKELNSIIKDKTKAIIYKEKIDEFSKKYLEENGISIIKLEELKYRELDKFIVLNKDELRKVIEMKSLEFEKKLEKDKEKVLKIFEEYRKLKI
ncbi:MAG TPA: DUF460 domain-containing protein [Geobacterales bacterium]|nr:DUF460 domain-containing protein [Geobacterales bacterium]